MLDGQAGIPGILLMLQDTIESDLHKESEYSYDIALCVSNKYLICSLTA